MASESGFHRAGLKTTLNPSLAPLETDRQDRPGAKGAIPLSSNRKTRGTAGRPGSRAFRKSSDA